LNSEKTKKFDKKLHDENDAPAKQAVANWIRSKWDVEVKENTQYEVDLVFLKDDKVVGYGEVEVRYWGSPYCPHPTIHIAKRKEKLLRNDLPTVFFAVNEFLTGAYWCGSKIILESPLVEVKNKYVSDDEYFYDVAIVDFRHAELEKK